MSDNEKYIKDFVKDIPFDTPDNSRRDSLKKELLNSFPKHRLQSKNSSYKIRRIIMKSKITKIAAAVVILGLVTVGVTLIEKTTTPAYAVEQTVEAMRKVTTMHCFGTLFTIEQKGQCEMWIEVNPETREIEKLYSDIPEAILVETKDESYMYQKKSNIVIHTEEGLSTNEPGIGPFWIEDMVGQIKSTDSNANIEIYEVDGEKPIIILAVETDGYSAEFKVDPVTKLPISWSVELKGNEESSEGMICVSVDEIYYNEPLPEGIFEFVIPEGAQVIEQ